MELVLNLAWLLLALPSYWLWRRSCAGRTEQTGQKFRAIQSLLALGCALVVLFPVISATDDLRAMRAEMEESPTSKRNIRQASMDAAGVGKWQHPAIVAGAMVSSTVSNQSWLQIICPDFLTPVAPAIERVGRAPPVSFLLS
jgi:hypothetical protein